jgi:hypothetical protein
LALKSFGAINVWEVVDVMGRVDWGVILMWLFIVSFLLLLNFGHKKTTSEDVAIKEKLQAI